MLSSLEIARVLAGPTTFRSSQWAPLAFQVRNFESPGSSPTTVPSICRVSTTITAAVRIKTGWTQIRGV